MGLDAAKEGGEFRGQGCEEGGLGGVEGGGGEEFEVLKHRFLISLLKNMRGRDFNQDGWGV